MYVGNLPTLFASLNRVGRTSMEVGVRVEAEDPRTGKKTHTNSRYFTMVALDDTGTPVAFPALVLETDADRRRFREGTRRAEQRRRRAEWIRISKAGLSGRAHSAYT